MSRLPRDAGGREKLAARLTDEAIAGRAAELRRMLETPQAMAMRDLLKLDPLGVATVFLDRLATRRGPLSVDWTSGPYLSRDQRLLLLLGKPVKPPQGTQPAPSEGAATSAPRVNTSTQRRRDDQRRNILESELSAEQDRLEQARRALAEQEAIRLGDERNYQRVLDRLKPYQDQVALQPRRTSPRSSRRSPTCARDKNLELIYIPSRDDLEVFGDKHKLRQVLVNLILNSIKYTKKGKIEVLVEEEGKHAKIMVRDTGIGIPENYLDRIFERFFRIDKARSRSQGGTGLGLAIVKHIIEAHNSKVLVTSQEGEGSEFSFLLKK